MTLVFGTVSRVTFGRNRDEESGKYLILHKNKSFNLYSSNNVGALKTRKLIWVTVWNGNASGFITCDY
jgi:hypothetical protein